MANVHYRYNGIEYQWKLPSYYETISCVTAITQLLNCIHGQEVSAAKNIVRKCAPQFRGWLRPVGLEPPDTLWSDDNFLWALLVKEDALIVKALSQETELPESRTKLNIIRSSGNNYADSFRDLSSEFGPTEALVLMKELTRDEVMAYCWRAAEASRDVDERNTEYAVEQDKKERGNSVGSAKSLNHLLGAMKDSKHQNNIREEQKERFKNSRL